MASRRTATTALIALLAVLLSGLVGTAAASTSDPLRGDQWGLDVIGVDDAWQVSRGEGVTIAVVDTGVALDHPDLRDRLARRSDGSVLGLDLIDGGAPHDSHGHGTLVAGIAAATADNGEGIAGVAPRARIMPIRVLDGTGAGVGGDVDRAIRWAVDNGADVINLSLEAAPRRDGRRDQPAAPDAAVRYAAERDVVVIVAAGNTTGAADTYPLDTPALLVGASDRGDRPSGRARVERPDAVLAPGVGIVSTWCRRSGDRCRTDGTPYGVAEGTSFAAPHVSGVAAMLVADGIRGAEAVERLRDSATPLPGSGTAGRLDAAAAIGARGATARRAEPPAAPAEPPDLPRADPAPPPPTETAPPPPAPEPDPEPTPEPEPEPVPEPQPDPEPEPEPEGDADDVRDLADEPADERVVLPPPPPREQPPAQALGAEPVPGDPRGGPITLAVALLAATMATWSTVARRSERAGRSTPQPSMARA